MNKIKRFSLLLSICLLVIGLSTAAAQQSVKIYATDGVGLDSVTIGIDPSATGHIDPSLGEYELPPFPPTFDFRCWSLAGWDTLGSTGSRTNYHKQVRPTQKDIYKFAFKSDATGEEVTFSWPSNLGSLYGGYWRLLDGDGTELCDMTTQTSFKYHTFSEDPQYVMIVKGDGIGYLTARVTDFENAVDSKGKPKAEKRKNVSSEGEFSFTNTSDGIDALYVEFSQSVDITQLSPFDKMTDNSGGKKKKWTFEFTTSDTLPNPATVTMFAIGNKGKELVAKKYWWIPQTPPAKWRPTKLGPVNPNSGTSRLRLNMPNWHNLGEEVYGGPPPAFDPTYGMFVGLNIQVGTNAKGKPVYKYVYLPKYKDVDKSLRSKGSHLGGATTCLETMGGKPIEKKLKGLTADKLKNELFAQLTVLKINIASSKYGHTGPGFGGLHYLKQTGDPDWVNDLPVDTIVAIADNYFSCYSNKYHIDPDSATGPELNTIISNINAAFSGTFDTLSFGVKTVLKPAKYLVETEDILYRPSLEVEPTIVQRIDFSETTPVEFKLHQNYPNPFNPSTTISFDLSDDAIVTLKVYNLLGQEVATVVDHQEFYEGNNEVVFDASSLASGVYYYRLIVNDGEMQQVKKMMLLK